MKRFTAVMFSLALLGSAVFLNAEEGSGTAAAPAGGAPVDAAKSEQIAQKLAPSLVRVEYTLRFDKGEPPTAGGWSYRCASCGQYHGVDAAETIQEERPFEISGFLIADDVVITSDPQIHPRFVKSIAVRHGNDVVEATLDGYAKDQAAALLKLARPLKDAKAVTFDTSLKGPYLAVTYTPSNGDWATAAQGVGTAVVTTASGRKFIPATSQSLIVDKDGNAIGVSMRDELPPDDSWKGSPLQWQLFSAEQAANIVNSARDAANRGLLRVTLHFRSPKARGPQDRFSMGGNDEEQATLQHAMGVLVDPTTMLVLRELKPNVTARLERIRVTTPDGKTVNAKFRNTLLDYGALVVTLEKPLSEPVKIATSDVLSWRNLLLGAAQVKLQGEKRVEYFNHRRVASFDIGWRRQLYPQISGDAQGIFLFDETGALIALPVSRRDKGSQNDQYSWSGRDDTRLTPAAYLATAIADTKKYGDPGNAPLSEDQENQLAWIGAEFQPLTPQLARANDVAHLTNDGRTGALVTYVYPNSPAAREGIEAGDILVRINFEDQPKPFDIAIQGSPFGDRPFPWERLDELPEQYFDQIPQPWPSAENNLTRLLTDQGFGKKFTAEFSRSGKVMEKSFSVEKSPAHFDAAERYKFDPLGITVRNLTYEVRRYFQRNDDEPGLVISKIEMGSKASTAGLKPYEVITHVNDVPVKTVKDFEAQVKGKDELRLSIKRMTQGRQVRIKLATKAEPAKKDGAEPAKTTEETKPEQKPAEPEKKE